jgi:hypothetical protein
VVVLYAARYGAIPLVINVAGRYDLREGVDTRFGADIYSRVLQGPVSLPAQRDDGVTFTWQLTKEVRRCVVSEGAVTAGVSDEFLHPCSRHAHTASSKHPLQAHLFKTHPSAGPG